jgi:alpha-mannosidase
MASWKSQPLGLALSVGREADELPVWVGEPHLEAHGATLTTHSEVKLAKRRAEEPSRPPSWLVKSSPAR